MTRALPEGSGPPPRVVIDAVLPDGVEDLWGAGYADLVALA